MIDPIRGANDHLLTAAHAAAPDDASGDAGAQLVAAAVLSSAQGVGDCSIIPGPETLGLMADSISELSLQTGARVPDVASLTLCAAVIAARVAGISLDVLTARLPELYRAPMLRPTLAP